MGRKAKLIIALAPMIILVVTVWWFYEYQGRRAYRQWVVGLMEEDCYAVDATYDEQDLPTNDPKVWDCSKDILGEFKTGLVLFQTSEDGNKTAFSAVVTLVTF